MEMHFRKPTFSLRPLRRTTMSGNWLKSSSRKAQASAAALDFSQLLKDPNSFNFHSKLREIGLHSQISALAYDPTQSLLVVGTFSGHLYLFGQAGVETNFPTSSRGIKIKHLSLAKGILCVVGVSYRTLFSCNAKIDCCDRLAKFIVHLGSHSTRKGQAYERLHHFYALRSHVRHFSLYDTLS